MKSILVIEDEERISAFIAKGLTAAGFRSQIAADGITGRDLALTGDFALVILDIGLPGLDGFSVLEQLRQQRPFLFLAIVTVSVRATERKMSLYTELKQILAYRVFLERKDSLDVDLLLGLLTFLAW